MKTVNKYDNLFEELYYKFYIDCGISKGRADIEAIREELRESLSKEDRKKVLKIVDLYDMIINVSTKANFKHGFMIAHKLMLEMKEPIEIETDPLELVL